MRASFKNKNIDRSVNTQYGNGSNVTNKFLVLNEEDSDTENMQHNSHTNNIQCDDGFVEVKRNKKNKFDQGRQTNKNECDKSNKSNQSNQPNQFDKSSKFGTSVENIYSNKQTSHRDNKNDNLMSDTTTLDTTTPTVSIVSTVSTVTPTPTPVNGLSKFATKSIFTKFSNTSTAKFGSSNVNIHEQCEQDENWETQVIKKSKNRKDEHDGKQIYEETQYEQHTEEKQYEQCDQNDTNTNEQFYVESRLSSQDMGNNMFLHCPWTVWTHKENCDDWTEKSYTNVYEIDSIGKFWRFFNNFHLFDKKENQFFIMRKKIKPIWEDNENRKGGICSIKFDSFSKPGKIDVGTEMMISICLLIMNETFLLNNEEINGVSYDVKNNRSVLIKIWSKNYTTNMPDKIPTSLMIKFDTVLRNIDKSHYGKKIENKISIRYKPIKPDDESN